VVLSVVGSGGDTDFRRRAVFAYALIVAALVRTPRAVRTARRGDEPHTTHAFVEPATVGKVAVSIKITTVSWPTYPDHTPKSKYINAQALPILQQETFRLKTNAATKLANVTGASNTTTAWLASLQGALTRAETR
jgi:uncharacterized protein with FMN-binding domain